MTNLSKIRALIDKIHIVADDADAERMLQTLAPERLERPVRVAFVNAHALNLCYRDESFLKNLLKTGK